MSRAATARVTNSVHQFSPVADRQNKLKGMAATFGFNNDELKLLLVAVRQMRRTFAQPRKSDPALEAYAQLYDNLFEKLRDMAGPLPDPVEDMIE